MCLINISMVYNAAETFFNATRLMLVPEGHSIFDSRFVAWVPKYDVVGCIEVRDSGIWKCRVHGCVLKLDLVRLKKTPTNAIDMTDCMRQKSFNDAMITPVKIIQRRHLPFTVKRNMWC